MNLIRIKQVMAARSQLFTTFINPELSPHWNHK